MIEILVVVAIVGLLASLLLPTLTRARAQAVATKCRSNLHELGLGLAMYVDDNRGAYPYPNPDWWQTMSQLVDLPARDRGVLRCPSLAGAAQRDLSGRPLPPQQSPYGYNLRGYHSANDFDARNASRGLGFVDSIGGDPGHPTRESEVRVPSDMIAIGDAFSLVPASARGARADAVSVSGDDLVRNERLSFGGVSATYLNQAIEAAAKRHSVRANIAFCDAHVESVPFKTLFFDKSDASLQRWNKDHEPHRTK